MLSVDGARGAIHGSSLQSRSEKTLVAEIGNRILVVVRWLLFVPGAVVLSMLAAFVILYWWGPLSGGSIEAPGVAIPANAFSGFVLVFAGSWIAPSRQKTIPALVLLVIAAALFLQALLWAVEDGLFEWWDTESVLQTLQDVASLVGAFVGFVMATSMLSDNGSNPS